MGGVICRYRRDRPCAVGVRCLLILGVVTLLLQLLVPANAQAEEKHKASTSRASRKEATNVLPLDRLSPEWQDAVTKVTKKASIYRRLPTQAVDCDPELYDFLLNHPDLLVNIWEAMGISNVSLEKTGDNTYQATDGEGTDAKLITLHRTAESLLIYAQGTYHGPIFRKPIRARCVMHLRYASIRETNGRYYVTAVLDTFIKLDHVGVEMLAKTFYPLVGKVADYNFRETMNFASSLSRAIETRPQSVDRLADKLTRVTPEVREEFLAVSERISEKSNRDISLAMKQSEVGAETRVVRRDEPVAIHRKKP